MKSVNARRAKTAQYRLAPNLASGRYLYQLLSRFKKRPLTIGLFGVECSTSAPVRQIKRLEERRFEAARVGVHILDVEAMVDVSAAAGDDRNRQNALFVRQAA